MLFCTQRVNSRLQQLSRADTRRNLQSSTSAKRVQLTKKIRNKHYCYERAAANILVDAPYLFVDGMLYFQKPSQCCNIANARAPNLQLVDHVESKMASPLTPSPLLLNRLSIWMNMAVF